MSTTRRRPTSRREEPKRQSDEARQREKRRQEQAEEQAKRDEAREREKQEEKRDEEKRQQEQSTGSPHLITSRYSDDPIPRRVTNDKQAISKPECNKLDEIRGFLLTIIEFLFDLPKNTNVLIWLGSDNEIYNHLDFIFSYVYPYYKYNIVGDFIRRISEVGNVKEIPENKFSAGSFKSKNLTAIFYDDDSIIQKKVCEEINFNKAIFRTNGFSEYEMRLPAGDLFYPIYTNKYYLIHHNKDTICEKIHKQMIYNKYPKTFLYKHSCYSLKDDIDYCYDCRVEVDIFTKILHSKNVYEDDIPDTVLFLCRKLTSHLSHE